MDCAIPEELDPLRGVERKKKEREDCRQKCFPSGDLCSENVAHCLYNKCSTYARTSFEVEKEGLTCKDEEIINDPFKPPNQI